MVVRPYSNSIYNAIIKAIRRALCCPHHSLPTMSPYYHSEIRLHPLLLYTSYVEEGHPCCPLVWDIRKPPTGSKRLSIFASSPEGFPLRLTPLELSQHATTPPVSRLIIYCGIFPRPWPIDARSSRGVSILDVLDAIYSVMITPIKEREWESLSRKEKHNISVAFHERCRNCPDPHMEKSSGVRREDCLCGYSRFAGMEILNGYAEGRGSVACVLTLDRNRIPQARMR
jgi:hypothetical protein